MLGVDIEMNVGTRNLSEESFVAEVVCLFVDFDWVYAPFWESFWRCFEHNLAI